jgi:hypothetical protein
MNTQTLTFQPPHLLNEKEKQFLASLSNREKELQSLASEMLGSSYFVGKTHGYTKWLQSGLKTNPAQQPPATK